MGSCVDLPLLISNPHFQDAEEKIYNLIEGLSPDPTRHRSIFHFHPKVGMPLGGAFRFQFNIKISHFRDHFKAFPDGSVLPIAWLEMLLEEDWLLMKFFMFMGRFADFFEIFVKFGSVAMIFYSCFGIVREIVKNKSKFNYSGVRVVE